MLNVTPCLHCGHVEENTHWNPPGTLALVDSELLIKVPAGTWIAFEPDDDGIRWLHIPAGSHVSFMDDEDDGVFEHDVVVKATRTKYLQDKQGDMTYKLSDGGGIVVGKFQWTHP